MIRGYYDFDQKRINSNSKCAHHSVFGCDVVQPRLVYNGTVLMRYFKQLYDNFSDGGQHGMVMMVSCYCAPWHCGTISCL